ncbi:MAG TPA: hypothetical protein VKA46_02555 [Gemmataceae bacterium]|nr:hypothetical protein [Gemmataceae bacterium]
MLYGARDPLHYRRLEAALAQFPNVDFPEVLWEQVGHHLFLLRSNSVTVPFPNVVIATDIEVWTRDHHYPLIQRILPALRLFQELP